jgi:hypothetical protein
MPLFEAVTNSIDAIEDAQEADGYVEIEVIREPGTLFGGPNSGSDRQLADIIGFAVRDNGIGFNERNYSEFNRSDTTYKASRGGKGIGRFMWLVAFDKVSVDSVYIVNDGCKRRRFDFTAEGAGITKHTCEDAPGFTRRTEVNLLGYKDPYRAQCPKRVDTLAAYIVEEFLDVFLGPSSPRMMLHDNTSDEHIDLDEFYDRLVTQSERRKVTIKAAEFEVLHVRLQSTHITTHCLYFCAHDRVVAREKLTGIPNLAPRLTGDDGMEFVYSAYVSSRILDAAVNANRTGFDLPEDSSELLDGSMSLCDIRRGIQSHCGQFLLPYTEPVKERKHARICRFVEGEGVMYRPILKRIERGFDEIDPDASDVDIDLHLYESYYKLQAELRRRGAHLLEVAGSKDVDFVEFEDQFADYFEQVSELNQSDLARYVCHRKAIIQFLRRQLSIREDEGYHPEHRVHSIIFPRGKTSEDVAFDQHNLWLVDERLGFHVYLSSDKPIGGATPLDSRSRKRPDILLFDRAVAFSETSEVPFSSITIIEFKKPQRGEYSDNDNPFAQIADYVGDIKAGRARLRDGRSLPVSQHLPFYCYVVCDITAKLAKWAEYFELEKTPDGLGYFGYKRHLMSYWEVISYSKLVSDAEKRNRAFFAKLGLPPGPVSPVRDDLGSAGFPHDPGGAGS